MGLFFKKQYDILEIPFRFDDTLDQKESEGVLFIDLIFFGLYKEKQMRFNVTFQYNDEDNYYQMINFLKQYENNTPIKIKINVKKIQNFYVDLDDMSNKLSNSEIRKFERICWGAFDEEELFNK